MMEASVIATFTGLCNGPGGQVFAIGGFVQPMAGEGTLAALGDRCPLVEPVDPYVEKEVLRHLKMGFAAESTEKLLRGFQGWLSGIANDYAAAMIVIVDEIDTRYEADLIEICRQVGLSVPPQLRLVQLSDLLKQAGVEDRPSFENQLGYNRAQRSENYYHPNNPLAVSG
jgi:hypothetical protein